MSKLDINQADLAALAQLEGIGEELASRIVAYRETVHPFSEIIELAAVPGISERMVRALSDQITVTPSPPPEEDSGTPPPAVSEPVTEVDAPAPVSPESEMDASAVEPPTNETEEEAGEAGQAPPAPEERVVLEVAPAEETPAEVPQKEPPAAIDTLSVDEEETAAAAPPPRSPRRPLSCLGYLFTSFFGALLGVGLTIFFLYLLNNTLVFATPAQLAGLQNRVTAQDENQAGLKVEVDTLSSRLATASAAEATTGARLEETTDDLATLERELATVEAQVGQDVDALSTRVSQLAAATENFDVFLDGMRDLLIELRGLPPSPTPTATPSLTATVTITGTAAAGEASPTPENTPTPTAVVTRTPRPTATPFVSPSPTPADIP